MEDIAREAGVSRALVSIAMRDAHGVSAATREHILEVARRLGYRHNRVAADLAGRGAGAIGVLVADLHNDLYADVFDGIREILDPSGRRIVLTVGAADGSRDTAGLDGLLEARVGASIGLGVRLPDAELHERSGLGPPSSSRPARCPGCSRPPPTTSPGRTSRPSTCSASATAASPSSRTRPGTAISGAAAASSRR